MAITMYHRGAKSERRCALRMRQIELGRYRLDRPWYTPLEVADRYEVHVQSVYDGIRFGHALYPVADAVGDGPRPRRRFSREAIEACDRARLLFYKTTPSWHQMMGSDPSSVPRRRSAAAVIAAGERGEAPRVTDAVCDGLLPLNNGRDAPRQEGVAEGRSVPSLCASSAPNLRQCAAGSAGKSRETPGSGRLAASP